MLHVVVCHMTMPHPHSISVSRLLSTSTYYRPFPSHISTRKIYGYARKYTGTENMLVVREVWLPVSSFFLIIFAVISAFDGFS